MNVEIQNRAGGWSRNGNERAFVNGDVIIMCFRSTYQTIY